MSVFASPRFLRNVMLADAASCLATGALQVGFTPLLAQWLQLPAPLLAGTGWFLLAYAAAAAFVGTRQPVPRGWVGLFAAGNLAWAVGCFAVFGFGLVAPSALGTAWIAAQVLVVLAMADLQWMGLRRQPVAGWA
jgi:hypothetical protein